MSNAINVGGAPAGLEQQFAAPGAQWDSFPPSTVPVLLMQAGSGATYTYVATGGMALSGAAPVAKAESYAALGGLQLGGAAVLVKSTAPISSGGLNLSGAVEASFTKAVIGVGGALFGGDAIVAKCLTVLGSGGLQFAGGAALSKAGAPQSSGGLQLGGAAEASFEDGAGGTTYAYEGAGGRSFGGSAVVGYFAGAGDRSSYSGFHLSPAVAARLRALRQADLPEEDRDERPKRAVYEHAGAARLRLLHGRAAARLVRPADEEDELLLLFRKAA